MILKTSTCKCCEGETGHGDKSAEAAQCHKKWRGLPTRIDCFKSSRKNNSASEKHVVSPGVPVWLCLNYRHSLGICKIINNKKKNGLTSKKRKILVDKNNLLCFLICPMFFPLVFLLFSKLLPSFSQLFPMVVLLFLQCLNFPEILATFRTSFLATSMFSYWFLCFLVFSRFLQILSFPEVFATCRNSFLAASIFF